MAVTTWLIGKSALVRLAASPDAASLPPQLNSLASPFCI
jgi:hypothetical protein